MLVTSPATPTSPKIVLAVPNPPPCPEGYIWFYLIKDATSANELQFIILDFNSSISHEAFQ